MSFIFKPAHFVRVDINNSFKNNLIWDQNLTKNGINCTQHRYTNSFVLPLKKKTSPLILATASKPPSQRSRNEGSEL